MNKNETITPNKYNKADLLVEKIRKAEREKYIPSEEVDTGRNSRVVLINHLKNGSVGAAIATGISGVWITTLIVQL